MGKFRFRERPRTACPRPHSYSATPWSVCPEQRPETLRGTVHRGWVTSEVTVWGLHDLSPNPHLGYFQSMALMKYFSLLPHSSSKGKKKFMRHQYFISSYLPETWNQLELRPAVNAHYTSCLRFSFANLIEKKYTTIFFLKRSLHLLNHWRRRTPFQVFLSPVFYLMIDLSPFFFFYLWLSLQCFSIDLYELSI